MTASCISIISIFLISLFIFARGVPAIIQIGAGKFLFGTQWQPGKDLFGILPMITASVAVTLAAFVLSSFIGLRSAIFLSFYCPKWAYSSLKTMVELLAGIPSVIYGFFGMIVIVPIIRSNFDVPGQSILAAIIVLTIMILPTIISISEASINAVPRDYYEGAVALGATHTEAVFNVVVGAAGSGIRAAYILGIGRAIGETMAIILVAGNAAVFPNSLLSPVRTLTAGIAIEMGYANGLHQAALFGIGAVLFVFIVALNILLGFMTRRRAV